MKDVIVSNYGPGRFMIQLEDDCKLYVLSEKILKWNLKKVFGLRASEIRDLLILLDNNPRAAFRAG